MSDNGHSITTKEVGMQNRQFYLWKCMYNDETEKQSLILKKYIKTKKNGRVKEAL